MLPPLIDLNQIYLRADGQPAFEGASWQIQRGQHWAIWGPSGAGKSLLASAIDRSLALVHGQIGYAFDGPPRPFLNRHEIETFSAETHRVFLRQFSGYHQARWQSFEGQEAPSVADLLDTRRLRARSPYEILPEAPGEAKSQEQQAVVELFDLSPLLDRRVHQLSHGESRKVFLARLLLYAPQLLILDDPLSGLDQAAQAHFARHLEILFQCQRPALLFLTSRAEEIPDGVTHVLRVEGLQIADQGPRAAVLGRAPCSAARRSPAPGQPDAAAFERQVQAYAAALAAQPAAGEVVRMEQVTVRYGPTCILKEIHWTVQAGQRWALLGPNGAGKSTLLSLILADNPQAYRNRVFLFGQRRGSGESIWEIKQRIGWVAPELQIFYDRTSACQEVIASGFFDSVGLYHTCRPDQQASVHGWASAFGITDLLERPFATLSNGQQRLALLSRALVKHPPLLILDEPCQALDDHQRAHFLDQVERLCARLPLTLIYVTHQPSELPASLTHQIRLANGQIQSIQKM